MTDDTIPMPFKLVLRLDRPGMFMASTYQPVTEEILALALEDYNRQLSTGQTLEEAMRHMILYLEEAGVDGEVAAILVDAIDQGMIKADNRVLIVLNKMVEAAARDNQDEQQKPMDDLLQQ